jgi:uncharacterized protein
VTPQPREQEKAVSTRIAVNLPVKDLAVSSRFFAALGFPDNKQLTNQNTHAVVISDDIFVLLVTEPQFATITNREIPDTARTSEAVFQLQVDSRERVDELADKAFAAGALPANDPNDLGFLYGRSFRDPDGHVWDVFWLDPAPPAKHP